MPRRSQRSGPPVGFAARFVAEVHEVGAHRRRFVEWMRGAAVDVGTADDLEVVFSEVAANAVDASPSPSDDVDIRARLDDGMFVLEVSNRTEHPGDLPGSMPVPDAEDTLRRRGRGLLIARAYVDSVRMEAQLPDRFVVRCYRRLSPGR